MCFYLKPGTFVFVSSAHFDRLRSPRSVVSTLPVDFGQSFCRILGSLDRFDRR